MERTLATVAVVLLALAAISGRTQGTAITAPMFFTAAGLVGGVDALALVDPAASGETVKAPRPRDPLAARVRDRLNAQGASRG